jgi:ComEC/Rec2-related protein
MGKISTGDRAFAIAVSFLLGIFAANERWDAYALACMGFVCGVLFLVISKKWAVAKFIGVLFIAIAMGFLYYHAFIYWKTRQNNIPIGKQVTFFATVTAEPKSAGNFILLAATLSHPYAGKIDIFASPHAQFNYGDLLWIKGTVVPSETTDEAPAIFFPKLKLVAKDQWSWLGQKIIDVRSYIIQRFNQLLSVDESGLLSAIVLGATGALSTSLKAQMETSGTSYIAGMYGYKIAIIIAAATFALKDYIPKRILFFLTLTIVWLFTIASGASISVIRAAIMGSIVLSARFLGRGFSMRNALVFTAAAMAIINPDILTDAAFQLSFLSFLGIYYLGPPIKHFFHWHNRGILDWKEHAMLSLTTNVAIIPVVIKTFGGFSLTSLLSNILIMLPWPLILLGGFCVIIASFISPYLIFLVVHAVDILLRYELFIIKIFAIFTLATPQIFGSSLMVVLYYGTLIIIAYYYAPSAQENY